MTTQQADEILKELRAIRPFWNRFALQLSPVFISQQAAALQLDMQQFDTCTTVNGYDSAIDKDVAEAAGYDVSGTPTFFVGKTTAQGFEGFRIVGAQPFAVFQHASRVS